MGHLVLTLGFVLEKGGTKTLISRFKGVYPHEDGVEASHVPIRLICPIRPILDPLGLTGLFSVHALYLASNNNFNPDEPPERAES